MFKKRKTTRLPAVCAVIVAAGSSRRMGGENKLLLLLHGVPVLAHTLSAFEKCAAVRDIVLVCREQDIVPYTELARAYGIGKLRTVTRGGDSRTASVLAGIAAAPEGTALVAVHDGARPLVSEAVIAEAVYAAAEYGAAAPVVPVKDSIKRIENGCIAADVPRDTLSAVQTPQVFRRETLLHALQEAARAGRTFTDDCAAVEACGQTVRATHGSYENIKITTPEDIASAEAFLQREAD
ncbi:MAG: 2-C-methyl-D-erythritol 4-phosphate cytidylyltransferase [Agathobaculum sp.]|uniref:2-C-methyl-D-erythritol 4-phosphate cytidylyltransferase n=1 Tax=Agathobaculum sp. TaxID=2048138 RepID=UPI003D8EFBDE